MGSFDMMSLPSRISLFQVAATMAAEAHAGQKTRNGETPFIAHPVRVAITVATAFGCGDEEVIAAALLHDTLEKTSLPSGQIAEALGPQVLDLVLAMTKRSSFEEEVYWQHLKEDIWQARVIRMADALDHLDCPLDELPHRIDNARKALEMGFSGEEPVVRSRRILHEALQAAVSRLEGA